VGPSPRTHRVRGYSGYIYREYIILLPASVSVHVVIVVVSGQANPPITIDLARLVENNSLRRSTTSAPRNAVKSDGGSKFLEA